MDEKSGGVSMTNSDATTLAPQSFPPQPLPPGYTSAPPPTYSETMSSAHPQLQQIPPPQQTHVITNVVISRPSFGPFPVEMDCPYCQAHVVTATERIVGVLPWIIFAVCFVLGFFLLVPWCLCCIPFCIDSCLDVQHGCPNCKRPLGRYSRV